MDGSQPVVDGSETNKENQPPNGVLNPHPPIVGQNQLFRTPGPPQEKETTHSSLYAPPGGQLSRQPFLPTNVQPQVPAGFVFGSEMYTAQPNTNPQPYPPQFQVQGSFQTQQTYLPQQPQSQQPQPQSQQVQQTYQQALQQQTYPPYPTSAPAYPNAYPTDPFQRPGGFQAPAPSAPGPAMPAIDPALWPNNVVISAAQFEEMQSRMLRIEELNKTANNQQRLSDESQSHIDATIKEFKEFQAAIQANLAGQQHKGGERKARNNSLITVVHQIMRRLLHVVEVPNEQGEMVKDPTILPEPLPDGAPPNLAPEGTRLFNPRWLAGITQDRENREYRDAAVALIRSSEGAKPESEIPKATLDDTKALQAAIGQYFNTLRGRYKADHDAAAKIKATKLAQQVKLCGRKKQLAMAVRQGVGLFKKRYGPEATEGIESLIHTDWMPSEHSDCGSMDPVEFGLHRSSYLGENTGWETRDLLWRSKRLVKLYAMMVQLYREEQAEQAPRRKRQKKTQRTPTFPCLLENANDGPPALITETSAMPYHWCVSQAWAERTDNMGLQLEVDPDFVIFKLDIPDEHLNARERAHLARYEN